MVTVAQYSKFLLNISSWSFIFMWWEGDEEQHTILESHCRRIPKHLTDIHSITYTCLKLLIEEAVLYNPWTHPMRLCNSGQYLCVVQFTNSLSLKQNSYLLITFWIVLLYYKGKETHCVFSPQKLGVTKQLTAVGLLHDQEENTVLQRARHLPIAGIADIF